MSESPCERFGAELLDAREPGDLAAAQVAHRGSCAGCRALADAHFALFARMAQVELAPPPAAWAAIAARVSAAPAPGLPAPGLPSPGLLDRVMAGLRALAAPGLAVAGVCAVVLMLSGRSDGVPYRAGGQFAWGGAAQGATGTVTPGERKLALMNDAWVELKPDAASQVRIEGPSLFKLLAKTRVELGSGHAVFDLGPQPAGFTVVVDGGEVRVVGTKFSVDSGPEGARVAVEHGVVEVRPRIGAALRLEAGGHAFLQPGGYLRDETPAPAPGETVPAPARVPPPVAVEPSPVAPPSISAVRPGGRKQGGF